MSFAVMTNVATMFCCAALVAQSVRLMRSLSVIKDGGLKEVVAMLDKATSEARTVLSELKLTLATDCVISTKLVEQAGTLRDELGVMIGIADAAAERIASAAADANSRAGMADEERQTA